MYPTVMPEKYGNIAIGLGFVITGIIGFILLKLNERKKTK